MIHCHCLVVFPSSGITCVRSRSTIAYVCGTSKIIFKPISPMSLVQLPLNWFLFNRTCFCNVFINMLPNNIFQSVRCISMCPCYLVFVPTIFWFFVVIVVVVVSLRCLVERAQWNENEYLNGGRGMLLPCFTFYNFILFLICFFCHTHTHTKQVGGCAVELQNMFRLLCPF